MCNPEAKKKVKCIKYQFMAPQAVSVLEMNWIFFLLDGTFRHMKMMQYDLHVFKASEAVSMCLPTDSQNKGKPGFGLHIVVAVFPGLTFEAEQVLFTSTVFAHILFSTLEDDAFLDLLILETELHHSSDNKELRRYGR